MIILIDPAHDCAAALSAGVGKDAVVAETAPEVETLLRKGESATIVLAGCMNGDAALAACQALAAYPTAGVIIVRQGSRLDPAFVQSAMRHGARDVVSDQELGGMHAAVKRVNGFVQAASRRVSDADKPAAACRVHAVFAAKGGVGKTTIATNTAALVARAGRRTLLVDLDLESGDAALLSQVEPSRTIAHAAPLIDTLDAGAVAQLTCRAPAGYDVLAAPHVLEADTVTAAVVGKVLDAAADSYDEIIIDCPPKLTPQVLASFDRATTVAMITTLDAAAIKNTSVHLSVLGQEKPLVAKVRMIVNEDRDNVGWSAHHVEEVLSTPVAARLPVSDAVQLATNHNTTLAVSSPSDPFVVALDTYTSSQILGAAPSAPTRVAAPETAPAKQARRGRLLGRRAREVQPA